MLRALTSYFFGGIENETPEDPIECETREVNDWLVVNLPDQSKDSINLNDDDDMYEIDDEDIRNELEEDDTVEVDESDINEMDLDEDDILLSVSFLMMPPDTKKLTSELSNDEYVCENIFLQPGAFASRPYLPPLESYLNSFCDGIGSNRLRRYREMFIQKIMHPDLKTSNSHKHSFLDIVLRNGFEQRTQRSEIVSEFERKDKVHVLGLTSPPMYSKNYVNHRHPEKLLNHDLLQRIKELEPEQQAVQRSAKKTLTRGQLNRQNKNYMYETSSKRNRRNNRQRNHSGANNNRKC